MDNPSNLLSQKLEDLKVQASDLFNHLVSEGTEYDFTEQVGTSSEPTVQERYRDMVITDSNCELPLIEVRNAMGKVLDMYVGYVSAEKIILFNMETGVVTEHYKFTDIASLEDQLVLLNEMYEYEF